MSFFKTLKSAYTGNAAGDWSFVDWVWPLALRTHHTLLDTRRAEVIVSRIAITSALFALLTPLWGAAEYLVLPREVWIGLAIGRVLATLGFIGILLFLAGEKEFIRARRALWMLFSIPTLFYLFSSYCLAGHVFTGYAAILVTTHSLVLLIVATGLSLFPLTLAEGALIALPLLLAKVAITFIYWQPEDWPASIGAVWLLAMIAAVALLASNSQLAFTVALLHQAIRDRLTNCFSRASGEELLTLQFMASLRGAVPLAVAFIDIDHFKRVNDEYGHEAGDKVLIDTVQHITSQLRTGDILCRWGGEEFVVIMPNTTCAQALGAMERLQKAGFGARPEGAPLTASIGIAERIGDGAAGWKVLVEMSDARMYQAKQAGRDRIVTCHTEG